MLGPVELVVMAFNDEHEARKVLKSLRKLQKQQVIRLFNAAVLVKNSAGKTTLQETEDVDTKRGVLFGAIAGALIGLLGGPGGAIVGAAAGAATGGMAADRIDLGFSGEFLDELKGSLKPGSSAILAIVEHKWVDRIVEELQRYEGKLLRHALKDEVAEQLAKSR